MSYDIFYRHQFIDLQDGRYLPYIEAGSSNCYDGLSGRDRRARSFGVLPPVKCETVAPTAQQMTEAIEAYIQEKIQDAMTTPHDWAAKSADQVLKSFGWWANLAINGSTRRTTAGAYRGFYLSGIKYAKTVEQIGPATVRVWQVCEDDLKKQGKPILPPETCRTSAELRAAIDLFEATYGMGGWGVDFSIWQIEEAIRERQWANAQKRRAARNKPKRVRPGYWVLRAGQAFFQRKVRGGHYYGFIHDQAKRFDTEGQAKRYAAQHGLKYQPEYFANI